GVSTEALERPGNVVPVRTTYLRTLQEDFARNTLKGESQRLALRQTRLDDVYYDSATGSLTFTGACVARWPEWGKADYHDFLKAYLQKLLFEEYLIPQFRERKPAVDVKQVRRYGNPSWRLQRRAVKALNPPEVLLEEAGFDSSGALR